MKRVSVSRVDVPSCSRFGDPLIGGGFEVQPTRVVLTMAGALR